MPRPISYTFRRAILKQHTDEGALLLLHIYWPHPETGVQQNLYLARNAEPISFTDYMGGVIFEARWFEPTLPSEDDPNLPQMKIVMDNVDSRIMVELRPLSEPPRAILFLAYLDPADPTTVTTSQIEGKRKGKLRLMTLKLGLLEARFEAGRALAMEPFPAHRYRRSDGFKQLRG